MKTIQDFCYHLLSSKQLEEKLISPRSGLSFLHNDYPKIDIPNRDKSISFSSKQLKFPKAQTLKDKRNRAIALHSFANHELLAIECMAYAIVYLPANSPSEELAKKGMIKTIKDEQKHFKLYCARLRELGFTFGDFPLNDFFWRKTKQCDDFQQFVAMMALTFEAANLDFAFYFAEVFRSVEDKESAKIMEIVLKDELTHVHYGVHWMKQWREDQTIWDYYLNNLPIVIGPNRGKGIKFYPKLRKEAGLDEEFIKNLIEYQDHFSVTKRGTWQK